MAKIKYILFHLLLLLYFPLFGQDAGKIVKSADKKYKSFAYEKAIELYKEAYNIDSKSYKIIKRLAMAYEKIGDTGETEKWMDKLFEINRITTLDYYFYATILLENGKFEEANKWLDKYAELKPDDKKIIKTRDQIEYIRNLVKDSTAYKIKPVSINTTGSEIGTCYFEGGIILSSTSIGSKKADTKLAPNNLPFLDLFYAKEEKPGLLVNPVPFAEKIKTEFNDGPVAYDPIEKLLYITRYAPQKADINEDENVFHLQIIIAEKKDNWTFKEYFFINSPYYSVAHASISLDGQFIFFSSDMPGGYGGYDIYFCYKMNDGKWSEPFNVGPVVNTRRNELFPFISSNGFLYFSSDGKQGLGKLDVYVASAMEGVYNTIRNLGYPINSTGDDVAFTLDNTSTKGYFSTNRVNSDGFYDIFSLELNFVPITIKGVIKEMDSKEVVKGIKVILLDENGNNIGDATSREDGSFSCTINKIAEIELTTQNNKYYPLKKKVDLNPFKPNDELTLEVFLNKK